MAVYSEVDECNSNELKESSNLVSESKMFVKDEAMGGVEWRVVYFGKLVFESDEQEFSLRGVKSKKINSHPGRDVSKSVLKVRNAWVKVEWVKREEELSIICVKVVVEGKKRDKSAERCGVHDEE